MKDKKFVLVSQLLSLRLTKQTSENVADTSFKVGISATCQHINYWRVLKDMIEPAGTFVTMPQDP